MIFVGNDGVEPLLRGFGELLLHRGRHTSDHRLGAARLGGAECLVCQLFHVAVPGQIDDADNEAEQSDPKDDVRPLGVPPALCAAAVGAQDEAFAAQRAVGPRSIGDAVALTHEAGAVGAAVAKRGLRARPQYLGSLM